MENLTEIIWYLSWPAIIYVGVKFVQLNLKHFTKLEKLNGDAKH